jgi:hypothetical protein
MELQKADHALCRQQHHDHRRLDPPEPMTPKVQLLLPEWARQRVGKGVGIVRRCRCRAAAVAAAFGASRLVQNSLGAVGTFSVPAPLLLPME